jgi:type I restriction enzyme S subunit
MNTKQLRQKILDLAIRGKLVPQDPNTTNDWKQVKLDDIAKAVDPQPSHRTPPICENGIPYVGITDCDYESRRINFNSARKVGYNVLEEHLNRYTLSEGDFIIGKIGTIGKPFFIPSNQNYALSANIVLIQPIKEMVDAKYLFYKIGSTLIENQFKKDSKATTQAAFGIQKVRNLDILLPPIAEQNRIVVAIESAFAVIDEIERSKVDLQIAVVATKSKILSLAIRGKLVPQDTNDEPASVLMGRIKAEKNRTKRDSAIIKNVDNYDYLPESWRICKLSDIGEIVGGGTPRTSQQSYWNGEIPWITPADLSGYTGKYIAEGSRKITQKGLSESSARLMPTGSVLFSSRAPIGYCVIAENEVCTNQGFKSIIPFITGFNEYIYYYLKSQVDEIRSRASGTTFKEISGSEFGNTIITLPPLPEQHRIVAAIEAAFEQLDNISESLK